VFELVTETIPTASNVTIRSFSRPFHKRARHMTLSDLWLSIYGFDYQYANATPQNFTWYVRRYDQLVHTIGFNPLNAELNPICHLLALLGGATIVDISRLRVNSITCISRITGSRFASDNRWLEVRGGWNQVLICGLEEPLVLLKTTRSGVEREPKNYATLTEHYILYLLCIS